MDVLATELQWKVAHFLTIHDLARLARTCHRMFNLTKPILYSRLSIELYYCLCSGGLSFVPPKRWVWPEDQCLPAFVFANSFRMKKRFLENHEHVR